MRVFAGRTSLPDGNFERIYTMGGRSFSIINTQTWETVYDSGSKMEEILRDHYPTIFNSEAEVNEAQARYTRSFVYACVHVFAWCEVDFCICLFALSCPSLYVYVCACAM